MPLLFLSGTPAFGVTNPNPNVLADYMPQKTLKILHYLRLNILIHGMVSFLSWRAIPQWNIR